MAWPFTPKSRRPVSKTFTHYASTPSTIERKDWSEHPTEAWKRVPYFNVKGNALESEDAAREVVRAKHDSEISDAARVALATRMSRMARDGFNDRFGPTSKSFPPKDHPTDVWQNTPLGRQSATIRKTQEETRRRERQADIDFAMPPDADPQTRKFLMGKLDKLPPPEGLKKGHYYAVITKVIPAEYGATREQAAYYLRRFMVPGRDEDQPAKSGEKYGAKDPRPWSFSPGRMSSALHEGRERLARTSDLIVTHFSEDGLSGSNTTLPGHLFHNGDVIQDMVQAPDGSWYLVAQGTGTVEGLGARILDRANNWQGPQLFKHIHEAAKKAVERDFRNRPTNDLSGFGNPWG